ncbi:hypothetical protein ACFOY4_32560 [Actinomadura syzygii]|uniref:Uncharacterized protein n=1 Tax=Actinomadura syzygii TaxID=1427538 RepID=A0A5D0UDI8_9ACTN|nr:hypothetical protein [Actinomadura syzygii]TYC15169.1 hypothetical protein FXF65_13820 [Actinomadura syzygii]
MNLLLGYIGIYPIGITWYVLKNTVVADLGYGHRDTTFDEGLLLPFTYAGLFLLAFAAISGVANYFLVRIWPFGGKWLWPIAAALLVLPGLLVIADPRLGWR